MIGCFDFFAIPAGSNERTATSLLVACANVDTKDFEEASISEKKFIANNKANLPHLRNMLLALTARQVAMATLKEMTVPAS